jgi:hypothetical protein
LSPYVRLIRRADAHRRAAARNQPDLQGGGAVHLRLPMSESGEETFAELVWAMARLAQS